MIKPQNKGLLKLDFENELILLSGNQSFVFNGEGDIIFHSPKRHKVSFSSDTLIIQNDLERIYLNKLSGAEYYRRPITRSEKNNSSKSKNKQEDVINKVDCKEFATINNQDNTQRYDEKCVKILINRFKTFIQTRKT